MAQKRLSQLPPAAIGTKQEIQARSGTATFVPNGHTIKIINSYGAQVVAVWAFALHDAPTEEEMEDEKEHMEQAERQAEAVAQSARTQDLPADPKNEGQSPAPKAEEPPEIESTIERAHGGEEKAQADADRPKDAPEDSGPTKGWPAYISSVRGRSKQSTASDDPQIADSSGEKSSGAPRKTWSSYLPSVPLPKKKDATKPKAWASYIPSGHGFSSYIPKDALSAISDIHRRDPNKSVAEQLYDFSKTPAGAAGLSSKTANARLTVS
jgi:hypothetical protein